MASEEKHGKTLFIRNLPYSTSNEDLEQIFSDVGPLKSCFVVGDKDSGKCRGFGYVKFTLLEDAQKALKTVKNVGGRNIQLMFAKRKEKKKKFGVPKVDAPEEKDDGEDKDVDTSHETAKNEPGKKRKKGDKKVSVPKKGETQAINPYNEGKRARLIVRNLSFKCNEKQLKEAFSKYGEVVDVHIPTKGAGKKLGFGFVQFATKTEAGMAVKNQNEKPILDRKVAVDFTLPKEKFEKRIAESKSKASAEDHDSEDDESEEEEEMEVDQQSSAEEEEEKESDGEDEEESDDGGTMESIAKRPKLDSRIKQEEEDDSDSEDEDEEDDEDSSDEMEEDEDEKDNESDSGFEHEQTSKSSKKRESDVSEGRTIFIRNLPFNISEEELEEHFATFGDINYARIVMDRETGMSRGTAFVQFKAKSSAESCLKGSGGSHELGGRELSVTLAVSRQKAVELVGKKDKPKEQKDSRNLYLVREGMIRPGTEQAKDVPEADLVRRQKIDVQKRNKLKDQDIFVSSTRLCIHNLPTSITDKQLRTIVLKATGDKKARLKECKIMRDLDRVNTEGVAKSRGYAFCAFSQHEHAMTVLRRLNNNPETFGPNKRPIVEFSLESHKALEVKQKRFEKSQFRQKQLSHQKGNISQPADPGKKKKWKQPNFNKKTTQPLENKKEQDKIARSLHKGSIGLPSHSGAKQRHKPRSNEVNKKTQKKPAFIKKQQEPKQRESQKIPKELKQKSRRQKPDTDNFDKLVASYKKKILSSGSFS